jgi:hypothetical protein
MTRERRLLMWRKILGEYSESIGQFFLTNQSTIRRLSGGDSMTDQEKQKKKEQLIREICKELLTTETGSKT